jgi:ECF transporter S component (folate family)
MQKRSMSTQVLTRVAVLVSMSVVLKVLLSFTLVDYRFTFYDVPIMITGIMFGPIIGAMSGFIVDWINILMPNLATGFNLFTISSMMWGIIPGLLLFGRNKLTIKRIVIATVITSFICFGINTVQLYMYMGNGIYGTLWARIITLFIKLPIQVMVIDILYSRVIVFDLKLLRQK